MITRERIRERGLRLLRRGGQLCRNWYLRTWAGTEGAVYHVSLAASALIWGVRISDGLWPGWPGIAFFTLGVFLLLQLAGWLAGRVLGLVMKWGVRWAMSFALLAYSTVRVVNSGAGGGYTLPIMSFSLGSVVVVQLTAAALRALSRRRFTPTAVLSALCFGGLTALLAVFLFTDGFDDHYADRYLALGGLEGEKTLDLGEGPWAVATLDYGQDLPLDLGTVSLSSYMSRSSTDELTELYLEQTLGYPLNRVPLIGRIWYPEGGQNCPVLFIAHGNHEVSVDSYLGYEYLGSYLASWGYVVVSVDQNACNLLSGENDGRAVLLLEHMERLLEESESGSGPLAGLMDPDRLVIAGHSRGGEMVATAYLFNDLDRYPENGNIEFDYHFNIRGIVAIAPTVDQYKPADHQVELENVNYLLLHVANDQDVTKFQGMTQYENISFTGEGDYLKSALLIANANHGQFNSLWGDEDRAAPFSSLLNIENFITEEEQETIAKAFIKVFLDVTLLEDDSQRDLLTNWERYRDSLPETVYVQCYDTSDFQVLADFEEDSDLTTGSREGVTLLADGVNLWTEELVTYHDGAALDNYGLRLRISGIPGSYPVTMPAADLGGRSVRFDLSDYDSQSVERGRLELLSCRVILTDSQGRTAEANSGDYATVYPPLPVRLSKLDYLFGSSEYKYAFTTIEIPAEDFVGEADIGDVVSITLAFDGPAHLRLDNIGLTA